MVPWVMLAVVSCLLIFSWEREDKAKARAERAESELARSDVVRLPSGASVEVFAWPEGPEGVAARRENARHN
jgi:hypothetical protein